VRPQNYQKLFELIKCLIVTTMAPLKPEKASQTARLTEVQTRSWGLLDENEQHQLEIIDIEKIASSEQISVNSTPTLEEIQQPQAEALKVDTPVAVQVPQNEEVEMQQEVEPKRTKSTLEVNGMA
jgi:hypothetical protein